MMYNLMYFVLCFRPPIIRVHDKVMIPQEEHPDINFVGLLIGPRGNTLKNLEKDVSLVSEQHSHRSFFLHMLFFQRL